MPGVQQPDFAPVACHGDLRISLGDCVDRTCVCGAVEKLPLFKGQSWRGPACAQKSCKHNCTGNGVCGAGTQYSSIRVIRARALCT